MLSNVNPSPPTEPFSSSDNGTAGKRKRRPAGTPDPDAEVVSLSPKTLLESDRYVCEICNQGFQRDQNLQMHRRRHKVPWKLLKRETPIARKRVFVCPEPSCHHDPCHALGDLVGIKKHFRRKHSNQKQWVCEKCSKGYAVQSDYKAHLKTCGTRGHSCDCGRVFSREGNQGVVSLSQIFICLFIDSQENYYSSQRSRALLALGSCPFENLNLLCS
ncbi:UNVERIFIED_CONTAM: protein indeterminate-domain 14 [Sesamum radiatum]|uniref:Protein indeterminate-domain 14 n=1 Tax=Sesamum radiatum TaxID=300843 RepID=A0AAW2V9R3_SESRA